MDSTENYLDQVIKLLIKGTELKTLHDSTSKAEQVLRRAICITDEHDLPKPWPQLVNYRLAHVLLRNAKLKKDFFEIDQLLNIAAISNCLGPLPRIYRLAAMYHTGAKPDEMKIVFDNLLDQIDNYAFYAPSSNRFDFFTALQNNLFNMLELAVYFTGYPYEGFQGKGKISNGSDEDNNNQRLKNIILDSGSLKDGDPYSDLQSKMEDWRLVGTIPGLASKAYPGELALEEIEGRMEKGELEPPCVAFRILGDKTIHDWNFNLCKKEDGTFDWIRVRSDANHLLFLTAILKLRGLHSRGNLLMRVLNDDSITVDNTFRKWKERCAYAIADGLNSTGNRLSTFLYTDVFWDDTGTDRPVPELKPGISVLGAIDNNISSTK